MQGSDLVAESTRQTVLEAIEQTGYVYHRGAASLRMRRSRTVGVLVTDVINPFFAELNLGIETELRNVGEVSLVSSTFDDLDRQTGLLKNFLEYQADGVLLVPSIATRESDLEFLALRSVPLVLMTRYIGRPGPNYVGVEDVAGGRVATQHLLDHGCTSLAYFGGLEPASARRDRVKGFHSAVKKAGGARVVAPWCVATPTSANGGYQAASQLLASGEPIPDGVVCHGDTIAFGLMRAFREAGLRPPRDVRVIGYDDIEAAAVWEPPLTTVSPHATYMGRVAAALLRKAVSGEPLDGPHLLPPDLIVRESCGCRGK
jgi:LacI family transcriptional regulator, galactose operon repressor